MWAILKPYLTDITVWIILTLLIFSGIQTVRVSTTAAKVKILTLELVATNDRLTVQDAEFKKLKAMAEALDTELKVAYAENAEIARLHAKGVEEMLKSRLPKTATCEDVAKWAKDIARGKK